jgi:hypothetical protein
MAFGRESLPFMSTQEPQANAATVVAEPIWLHTLYWIVFPILGAGLGWLLRLVAHWALGLKWVPFQGPLELIDSIPEPQITIGAIVLGALVGMVLAFLAKRESLSIIVSADRVELSREGNSREFGREQISAVFKDGGRLVLLGQRAEELASDQTDLGAKRLEGAFRENGYPWTDGDPHAEEFRRWVPDTPDLPTGANALFTARSKALEGGESDDVKELRAELAKLGVVVKDDKKRQYWRLQQTG